MVVEKVTKEMLFKLNVGDQKVFTLPSFGKLAVLRATPTSRRWQRSAPRISASSEPLSVILFPRLASAV